MFEDSLASLYFLEQGKEKHSLLQLLIENNNRTKLYCDINVLYIYIFFYHNPSCTLT